MTTSPLPFTRHDPAVQRTYSVTYAARPWTVNQERNKHFYQRAALVAEWRKAFSGLARFQKIPPIAAADIVVVHHRLSRASLPDVAAALPAAKAAIDGLCDAGVFVGDGPDVVRSLTFVAPAVSGKDALELVIYPRVGAA